MHRRLIITGTTAAIGLSTILWTGVASAAIPTVHHGWLAQTYDKSVPLDSQTQSDIIANLEARLNKAVTANKLTHDQANYILQARQDIYTLIRAGHDKQAVREKVIELRQWESDNNIQFY